MRGAVRFLLGGALGIALGMLVALVLTPSGGGMRRRRPAGAATRRKEKTPAR